MTTPLVKATQTIVDDTDTAIQYSASGWVVGGNAQEYEGTTHGASSDGASASYTFSGTSISVYGTADNASCSMKYTIDDQSMTLTTVTVSSIARAPNTLFYASLPLPSGVHHLTITREECQPAHTYWFDYLILQPSPASTVSVSPSGTRLGGTSATLSPVASTGQTANNAIPVIIGAVIGGIAIIFFSTAAVLFLRSRSRARNHEGTENSQMIKVTDVEAQAVSLSGVPSGHHADARILSGPRIFNPAGNFSNTSSSSVMPAVLRPTIAIPAHIAIDPFIAESTTTPRKKKSPVKVFRPAGPVQDDPPSYDEM